MEASLPVNKLKYGQGVSTVCTCVNEVRNGVSLFCFFLAIVHSFALLACRWRRLVICQLYFLLTERKKKISLNRKITTFFPCRFIFQKIASRPMLIGSYRLLCFTDKMGFLISVFYILFSLYLARAHLLCAQQGIPISEYEVRSLILLFILE